MTHMAMSSAGSHSMFCLAQPSAISPHLAISDSAALMLPARCSTRTAASHSSALCGFFSRPCTPPVQLSAHTVLTRALPALNALGRHITAPGTSADTAATTGIEQ